MKLWNVYKSEAGMDAPWSYDCAYAFVIRADDEAGARQLAADSAGDEGAAVWLDELRTTCDELLADGPAAVVLVDFLCG